MRRVFVCLVAALVFGAGVASAQVQLGVVDADASRWREVTDRAREAGIEVEVNAFTEGALQGQLQVLAAIGASRLDVAQVSEGWLPRVAGNLADLSRYEGELRRAGTQPVSYGGRIVGVRLPWRDNALAAVLARSRQMEQAVSLLGLLAGNGVPVSKPDSSDEAPGLALSVGPLSLGKPERAASHVDGALQLLLDAVRQAGPRSAVSPLGMLPSFARDAVAQVAEMVGIPLSVERSEVTVVLETRGRVSAQAAGARESTSSHTGLTLAVVPLGQLESFLEQMAGRAYVRLPYEPYAAGVTSEGVELIGGSAFHDLGERGAGTKIGIIDLGFRGLSTSQSRGDLPYGVTTRDFTGRGIESDFSHGTAVAEIVHDVAPEAQLYLIKIGNEVDLDNAVSYAVSEGIHVINHSLGWYNTNFYDGTGSIAQIAERAVDEDILWVQAAGNDAQTHYGAMFNDRNGDGWHDTDITLSASPGDQITLYLTWDSWPETGDDYDLYLYGPGGSLVASSTKTQGGTEQPTERITFTAPQSGTYRVRVQRESGSVRPFKLFSIYQDLSPNVSRSSIPAPGNLGDALTVGAVDWSRYTSGPAQDYSSRGPTTDGRTKPDLVGPDNVTTGVNIYDPFEGTSAAAPHVSGVAALLRGEDPSATGGALRSEILGMTVSMGDPDSFGSGRLEAYPADEPDELTADVWTDHGCGDSAVYELGERMEVKFRVDGIDQAYVSLVNVLPTGETRTVREETVSGGREVTISGQAGEPTGTRVLELEVWESSWEASWGEPPATTAECEFTVRDTAPPPLRADPGGPYSGTVGETIRFDGRNSEGDIVEYRWDMGDGRTRYGSTVQHSYGREGTYTVRLTVRGTDGRTDSATTHVTVREERLPNLTVERLDYRPSEPEVGDTITFEITMANIGNADAGSFYVRLQGAEDSRLGSIDSLSAGSRRTGTMSLPLTRSPETFTAIVDPFGDIEESDTTNNERSITVRAAEVNQPPVAQFNFSPSEPDVNEWITFDASNSYDPDARIVEYAWDFDDGATGTGRITQKRYSSEGTYTVRLTVTDNDGATDTTSRTVRVERDIQPPSARFSFSPTNPDPGETVSFDASDSTAPDGSIVEYEWDFGDGSSGWGRTVSHSYAAEGTYTVRLTVTDDHGGTDSTTKSIQVGDVVEPLPGMPDIDEPGIYVWGDPQNRWHVTVVGSPSWGSPRPFYVLLQSVGSFRNVSVTPAGAPSPAVQLNDKRLTWEGTVQSGWVDVSFTLDRGRVMQLTLHLDLDGDGDPEPRTSEEAANMVFLRDKKVSPRSNPVVFVAPDGARTLLPQANFKLATGSTAVHVIVGTIEELERRAR
ncbi:MAG: PKD domain-containing protein [Candidatus Bipolaricaulota bacterium]